MHSTDTRCSCKMRSLPQSHLSLQTFSMFCSFTSNQTPFPSLHSLFLFFCCCCFRQPMATCSCRASCLPHTVMKNQHKATHGNAADGPSPRLSGGETQPCTILKIPLLTSFLKFLAEFIRLVKQLQ